MFQQAQLASRADPRATNSTLTDVALASTAPTSASSDPSVSQGAPAAPGAPVAASFAPAAATTTIAFAQPIARGGGHSVVGDPYEVGGNWYTPQHDPTYNQVGLASWYGESFRGQLTADGEVFDDGALTAAHPTLPLPSYARVTNTVNHRSVLVRINDRGPFSNERMIDVSARTAELLDFKRYGIAKVQVEYVSPARIDGDDSAFLMASYRGPGVPAGAGATMLASAAPLPKRSAVAFPQVVPVSLPPVTVAAAADVIAPVQATTTATRPVRAVAVAATSTTAATGAPFDPFQALSDPRALMAPAAFSPGNGFKASNAPAASDTAAFRSSFAPDARVSAAFEAIASVAGP